MSLPLVFLPQVRDDVDEAYSWYEERRTGLGDAFLASLEETFSRIRATPALSSLVYRDVRVRITKRFPYGVYFRILQDQILVLAFVHHRRDRRVWRSRI